ncbi:MAG TPA: class I SAM-dependent methyltransferase [Bryobacteraceae bacterium]
MRWTTPPRRHGNASAWLKLNSHFRHGLFSCQSISSGTIWGEMLAGAGLQQNSPAFFTWLGVVPYLTQDAISSTLDYMASIQNSEVVFDYMEPSQAFSEEMRELVTKRTEQLEKMDERWASRFEPAGIAAILRSHGFSDIEDINFREIKSRFGRAVQGLAPGQAGLHVVHAKH